MCPVAGDTHDDGVVGIRSVQGDSSEDSSCITAYRCQWLISVGCATVGTVLLGVDIIHVVVCGVTNPWTLNRCLVGNVTAIGVIVELAMTLCAQRTDRVGVRVRFVGVTGPVNSVVLIVLAGSNVTLVFKVGAFKAIYAFEESKAVANRIRRFQRAACITMVAAGHRCKVIAGGVTLVAVATKGASAFKLGCPSTAVPPRGASEGMLASCPAFTEATL